MAKKSMLMRQRHREQAVKRFAAKRAELKELIRNPKTSDDGKAEAQKKLQKLPRDASPVRLRNRCALTGRPHGYYRKFGLVAHQAARDDDARRDPGRPQGQLVRMPL